MVLPMSDEGVKRKNKRKKQRNKISVVTTAPSGEVKHVNASCRKANEKRDKSFARKQFKKNHGEKVFKGSKNSKHHLSKELRVPEMYRQAARILKELDEKKASVKNLVFSLRRDIKKIYAIVMQSLKYKNVILRLTRMSKLFQKEKHLNQYLARVLIYDMMFGRKSLTGDSKPIQIILKHRGDITKALRRIMEESCVKSPEELIDKEKIAVYAIPRYARANTLLTTIAEVIKQLEDNSYHQLQYETGITMDEFYNLIKSLQKGQFMQDINFSDLLVFSQHENLSKTELYKNGHIILEDKTSYFAAKALNPPEGSTVLDGCAAPGIKTTHLAALMNNKGKIFACDINENRMEMLKDMIQFTGVKCCSTLLNDFTSVDPSDEKYSSVEYILLDPSCSGSGMVSRLDSLTDDENSKCFERIKSLSAFQAVLLKHALSFQNVKRIVYSTCSINVEENEEVINEALNGWEETYKVINIFPDWLTRGKEEYEFGPLCLRAYPNINYTNGFFIAVIERIEGSKRTKKKKKKAKNSLSAYGEESASSTANRNEYSHAELSLQQEVTCMDVTAQEIENAEDRDTSNQQTSVDESSKKHKRKRKKLRPHLNTVVQSDCLNDSEEVESAKKSKKARTNTPT